MNTVKCVYIYIYCSDNGSFQIIQTNNTAIVAVIPIAIVIVNISKRNSNIKATKK